MKILHVGWGYPPSWIGCGPVVYVHTLAMAQAAAGHQVVIACASDQAAEGRPMFDPDVSMVEGVPYVHLRNRRVHMHDMWNPLSEAIDPQCAAAFEQVLLSIDPDVVHFHNLVGLSFDIVGVARNTGARLVASLHNYFPICSRDDLFFANAERCDGPRARSCSNCLGTELGDEAYHERHRLGVAALNTCDRILAVSRRVAEIYAAQGVNRELLAVDRIGSVAAEELWRDVGELRSRSGTPPEGPVRLTFFGGVTPRKGIITFLQAIRKVARPEQITANVYGGIGSELVDPIQSVIKSMSPLHASRLAFHGGFSQSDLPQILSNTDVAVLPPRWEDNGPQTVMEALAAGVPVLGTRVGGLPDMVQDGRNGLLFDDGDPAQLAAGIDRLTQDPQLIGVLRQGIEPPVTMDAHQRSLERHYRQPGPARPAPPVAAASAMDQALSRG